MIFTHFSRSIYPWMMDQGFVIYTYTCLDFNERENDFALHVVQSSNLAIATHCNAISLFQHASIASNVWRSKYILRFLHGSF